MNELTRRNVLFGGTVAAIFAGSGCSVRRTPQAPATPPPSIEDTEASRQFVLDVNAFFNKIGAPAQFTSCVDASRALEVLLADQKSLPTILGYEIEAGLHDYVFGQQLQLRKDQLREAWDLRRRGAYWGALNPVTYGRPTQECG